MTLPSESRIASYQRLLVLNQVLASTLDLLTLLDLIVNAARDITRTEATSILLLYERRTGNMGEQQIGILLEALPF